MKDFEKILNSNSNKNNYFEKINLNFGVMDLQKPSSMDDFKIDIEKRLNINSIDILINNAAYKLENKINLTEARKLLDINYFGTKLFTEKMIPFLLKQNEKIEFSLNLQKKRIVMVSDSSSINTMNFPLEKKYFTKNDLSISELESRIQEFLISSVEKEKLENSGWGTNLYAFSKTCLNCLTKILSKQLSKQNILVFGCFPGVKLTKTKGLKIQKNNYDSSENIVFTAFSPEIQDKFGHFFANRKIVPSLVL